MRNRLPYLDGWRGLAILLVLLQHFGGVPKVGRFGVDLFFVLSGLLMSRILFEQRMPIGKFYRRRISRIMPVFLLFVAVCWIGWSDRGASWQELATTLTFTRTYLTTPTIWNSVLPDGNLWSLNIEEQCYVILAAIAAVSAIRSQATWILFALAALTIPAWKLHYLYALHSHNALPYQITGECASAPLLLSAAYRTLSTRWRAPAWAPVVALALAPLCFMGAGLWSYPTVTASAALLAFSVNHIQDSWRWVIRALEWPPLRQLGVLSYSVYLWQQIFYKSPAQFPYHTGVIAALLAGFASYYLIEQPIRRWLNAHWGVPTPTPVIA